MDWTMGLDILDGVMALASVVTGASAIAKVTPDETTNKWFAGLMIVVDFFALHPKTTKRLP